MEPQRFIFTIKQKIFFIILIFIGIAALLAGIFTLPSERVWANVLLNTFYFLSFSLAAVFFISVHIVGQSGWHTSIQRIPEAMGAFLPVSVLFMVIIVVFGLHDIYHWTHEPLDPVLEGKKAYLNTWFFIARLVIYFAGWIFLSAKLRQLSLKDDHSFNITNFKKSHVYAILFLVFFAITNSTSSWDLLMSIEPHWYSTLYAWYVFSSLFVSGIAVIILLVIYLKSKNYLPHVNQEHLHDLGKYLFGFSIFWMYLWFSQFMLIWYANIPEETIYFIRRQENFSTLMYMNVALGFFIPFLALLPRKSPRKNMMMVIASVIVIAGHWIDFYLAVMPGIMAEEAGINYLEIGLTVGYAGIFLWVVFRALSKASLVPFNHPFIKESFEYHNL
ncbi:MAG: hypothetical protein WD577_12850 [Bacteroidales bacterium]